MKSLLGAGVAALAALGVLAVGLGIANRDGSEAARDTAALNQGTEGAYRGSEPPTEIELVDFSLRDHDGAVVRSASLRGKVVLLTFLDSQCTESCPIIASQIARTFDLLSASERRRVFALAISTDPKEDTAASVRAFLRRNRALGKLHYVGGVEPEPKLRRIWKQFQILSSLESGEDTLHSAPVRIYAGGVWVATLHAGVDLTPANLAHDARVALARASGR
jgi:cytochrome oxidase Cu insertion factor (SCO1/SenC/PrrC family)